MTYEYQCKKCNKITEKQSTLKERKEKIKCSCGSEAKRIISLQVGKFPGADSWR